MNDVTIFVPVSSHDIIKALIDFDNESFFTKKEIELIITKLIEVACDGKFTRSIIKKLSEQLED